MENLRVYKLIKPTRELVEQFCSFWTVDGVENWMVELFENRDSLDIRDLIKEDDFRKMGENDAAIRALVQEKTLEALSLINAVYSTRVDADEITKGLQWEQLQENEVSYSEGASEVKAKHPRCASDGSRAAGSASETEQLQQNDVSYSEGRHRR